MRSEGEVRIADCTVKVSAECGVPGVVRSILGEGWPWHRSRLMEMRVLES